MANQDVNIKVKVDNADALNKFKQIQGSVKELSSSGSLIAGLTGALGKIAPELAIAGVAFDVLGKKAGVIGAIIPPIGILANAISAPIDAMKKLSDVVVSAGEKLINWGKNTQWLGRQLLYNLTIPIIGVGTAAVTAFGQMEDHLMRSAAAFGVAANRSNAEFRKIQDAVIDMAKHSIVPLAGISDAMYELASAGYTVDQAISALPSVIRLVEVAAVDSGDAVNYAVRQTQLWGDQGYSLQKILDITAVAVQKSTAHFSDFTHNVEMSAQFAKQANLNYEQLSASIAVLSNRGAVLGRIGFNVSQMFSQMVAPSDKAKGVLDEVGVSFYHMVDGMNKAKPMTQFLGELGDAIRTKWPKDLEKQAQALNDIFNIRAGRAALTLIDPKGLDDLKEFEALLTSGNIQGALEKMQELMAQDPWYRFKVAINSITASAAQLGQKIAEILAPYVEMLANKVSALVQWFNDLDPATQKTIGIFVALVAVIGPILIGFATFAEVIGMIITAVGLLINPMNILIALIGVSALTAIAGFVYNYVSGFDTAKGATNQLKDAVIGWWNKMKEAWGDPVVRQAMENVKTALHNVGWAVSSVINAFLGKDSGGKELQMCLKENKTQVDQLKSVLDGLAYFLNWLADDVIPKIPGAIDSLKKSWETAKKVFDEVKDIIGILERAKKVFSFTLDVIFPSRLVKDLIEWAKAKGYMSLHGGGLVGMHNGGVLKAQTGMIIPGSSPLRDRVPVMAEQGEGIMSKKAIENLLKNGTMGGGQSVTYNINFQPGVMIASPGEQRNFARKIKELIEQDNSRYIGATA